MFAADRNNHISALFVCSNATTVCSCLSYNYQASSSALSDARSSDGLVIDPGPLDLFDPLGFVEDTDSFPRHHAVEIKHGRIAMMAFTGMAVQELRVTFPRSLDIAKDYPFADDLKDGMGFPALYIYELVRKISSYTT